VCVCQVQGAGVETSVPPKGLLSRAMPAHFLLNTCHIVTGSMKGDEPKNDSSRTPHSWH